jgi:4-amino-4-deoxy-L-arabinose transferase-like glycosyltransferase
MSLNRFSRYSFLFGLVALCLAGAGQFMLQLKYFVPSIISFFLAVGLAILAFKHQTGPNPSLSSTELEKHEKWPLRSYIVGGAAIFFTIIAFLTFDISVPPIYPWLFHLTSIALLILSIAWVDHAKYQGKQKITSSWSWLEIGILTAIFTIAAFMRLYRFNQVPFGTWYDEANAGLEALKILNQPGYLPVFSQSISMPAHYLYLIALSFKILGVSILSLRAVNVVFGLGTVAAAFLAGQELFNRKMGLVVAFLLAVSRWDINWSRFGMPGVTVPLIELLVVGLIFRAFRRQRLLDYVLAGVSIGLGLCFYYPLRFFPVIVLLFLAVLWITRHDLFRSSWRGLIVLCIGALVASVPVLYLATFQPDSFWSRMQTVSIFAGRTPQEGLQAVAATTSEHLLMFNYHGDNNGRHNLPGTPMLDPITGALLVLGVGLCLWRIRKPGSLLLLAWLLLMLVPGIFSLDFEAPQSYRAIGSLPAAYLLAAVPIDALWQEWERFSRKRFNLLFLIPLVLVLGVSGFINYNIYFNQQAQSSDSWAAFSTPETIAAKVMAEMGNTVEYYVSTYYYQVPTIQFLAPAVTDYRRLETYDSLPLSSDGKKGIVFLFDPAQEELLLQAKRYYPSATIKKFTAPNGVPVLSEIYLHLSDIQASQGLTASYYHGPDWSGQPFLVRPERNINFDWQNGTPAPFPFSVEWKGILLADTYGNYQITTRSPAPMELTIDGVPVVFQNEGAHETTEISLAKGNHAILIRTQGMPGHYELDWKPPSGNSTPIPSSVFFLPPITNNGLLGQFYANPQWSGTPAFTEIDPWVDFYFQVTPLPRPYTVQWDGSIKISASGHYLFGLECIDTSTLWIDGKQVLDDQTPGQYQEAGMDLVPGFHSMRIRFADKTGYTHIYLYWTPPGADREIIPQEVLFPPQGDPELIKAH